MLIVCPPKPHDRPVVGDAAQRRRVILEQACSAFLELQRATDLRIHCVVAPRELPGVGAPQPIVRMLDLPAVDDFLTEHAVFIAQAVTHRWKVQRGQGLEETRSQTAEASVIEASIRLGRNKMIEVNGSALEHRSHLRLVRPQPPRRDPFADCRGQDLEAITVTGVLERETLVARQVALEGCRQSGRVHRHLSGRPARIVRRSPGGAQSRHAHGSRTHPTEPR